VLRHLGLLSPLGLRRPQEGFISLHLQCFMASSTEGYHMAAALQDGFTPRDWAAKQGHAEVR
jgi:hypothetical protein